MPLKGQNGTNALSTMHKPTRWQTIALKVERAHARACARASIFIHCMHKCLHSKK